MKTTHYYLLLILIVIACSCQGNKVKENANATDVVQLIPMPNKVKVGRGFLDISSGFKLNFLELSTEKGNNMGSAEIVSNLRAYLDTTALNISDSGVEVKFSLNSLQHSNN